MPEVKSEGNLAGLARILHINNGDGRGGAARIAMDLHLHMLRAGLDSCMLVGHKSSDSPRVIEFSRAPVTAWGKVVYGLCGQAANSHGAAGKAIRALAEPSRYVRSTLRRGLSLDVFNYPWTHNIERMVPAKPNIIHLHNLHGTYFDLRTIPQLSARLPVVITLHDMWLLTGRCAHSVDCLQWKTGCAACPCLPRGSCIRRIATSRNWHAKKRILQRCRLYIVTPSKWLMDRVLESHVGEIALDVKTIHNGVNTNTFHPGDRGQARVQLGLPEDAWILLFSANKARTNEWKDYESLRRGAAILAQRAVTKRTILVVLGDSGGHVKDGSLEIHHVPYVSDEKVVADYYRAADLYLHAAHADTFPTTILEALACGIPVVATAVDGIPEQVRALSVSIPGSLGNHTSEDATGILVQHRDSCAMADASLYLLKNRNLHEHISLNAAQDARDRFTIERQMNNYLSFYESILQHGDQSQ